MKKMILLLALMVAPLQTTTVTVSAGSIAIPIQQIILKTHYDIISRAPTYTQEVSIRGYSTTAALLLNGLAQTCMQVGNAIGTVTQNPITQGILHTVGISLATAAAVVTDRKQQREQKKADNPQLTKALADIKMQKDAICQAIKIRVGLIVTDWLMDQSLSSDTADVPLDQINGGLVLYTPSESWEELPKLIEHIAQTVTTKLYAVYASILDEAA
ncbi:hypothetical protein FJ365_04625 [Candidatus Dependentiae bacterium]|nr:hypothetical protein [Candidatus Dependentiae bacterium]